MTGGGQGVATGRRAAGADPAGHGPGHRRRHRRVAGLVAATLVVGAATAGIWHVREVRAEDANRPNTPWSAALLGRDGRSLLISYLTGHCGDGHDRVVVAEGPTTVTVGIVARRPRSGDCAAIGFFTSIEARLAGPLDRRQLLDADGRRHRPVPGTRVLRPTYLPYRVPLTTTSETPLPESDPSGWRLGYETPGRPQIAIQQRPAAAGQLSDQGRRIATVVGASSVGRRTSPLVADPRRRRPGGAP